MRRLAFSVVALGVVGCLSAETYNAKSMADIRTRAAFEMKCDASALKLTPLAQDRQSPEFVAQYGVEGCGQRVVYVEARGQWVANTTSDDGRAAATSTAAAAPAAR